MRESCTHSYISVLIDFILFHQSFLQVVALMIFRVWMLGGHLPYFTKQDNPASFSDCLATRTMTYWYLIAFNSWLLLSPSVLSYDWQMGSIPLVESLWDSRNLATLMFIVIAVLLVYSSVVSNKTDVSIADWPSSPGTPLPPPPSFAVLIVQTSYSETYSVYCFKKGKIDWIKGSLLYNARKCHLPRNIPCDPVTPRQHEWRPKIRTVIVITDTYFLFGFYSLKKNPYQL